MLGHDIGRSAWVRAVFRQSALSRCLRTGFPRTKPEARGTASPTEIRDSAPSPQDLTGKPSPTFAVGPFVVELFTAVGFADSRRGGLFIRRTPVLPVAREKLPTPAALNELAQPRKPEPHGRDSHPLCAPLVRRHRSSPRCADLLHRRGPVFRRGVSASPTFSHEYWIERRDYSDSRSLLPDNASMRSAGITSTSLH